MTIHSKQHVSFLVGVQPLAVACHSYVYVGSLYHYAMFVVGLCLPSVARAHVTHVSIAVSQYSIFHKANICSLRMCLLAQQTSTNTLFVSMHSFAHSITQCISMGAMPAWFAVCYCSSTAGSPSSARLFAWASIVRHAALSRTRTHTQTLSLSRARCLAFKPYNIQLQIEIQTWWTWIRYRAALSEYLLFIEIKY